MIRVTAPPPKPQKVPSQIKAAPPTLNSGRREPDPPTNKGAKPLPPKLKPKPKLGAAGGASAAEQSVNSTRDQPDNVACDAFDADAPVIVSQRIAAAASPAPIPAARRRRGSNDSDRAITEPHAIGLYDCNGTAGDELTFKAGDVVMLTRWIDSEWLAGYRRSDASQKVGIFPRGTSSCYTI